jgi:GTP-binding protein HflX
LQEAVDADLLLHVIDASSVSYIEQIEQVQKVLTEIDASKIPQILIFNKLDAMPEDARPHELAGQFDLDGEAVPRLYVSALTGVGIPALRAMLCDWVKSPL